MSTENHLRENSTNLLAHVMASVPLSLGAVLWDLRDGKVLEVVGDFRNDTESIAYLAGIFSDAKKITKLSNEKEHAKRIIVSTADHEYIITSDAKHVYAVKRSL